MNETLADAHATYALFLQLLAQRPERARREAFLALPAIVAAGDFALAQQYLSDPLERLAGLNQLASQLPLFPPAGMAPRLAAELMNFVRDVVLKTAVLQDQGRAAEAESLRNAALAGIA